MEERSGRGRWRIGLVAGLVGALVAIVFGFLTFGVQATAAPRGMPLAVAIPDGPGTQALTPITERLVEQGGDRVEWQVGTPGQAAELLDDSVVYGILELAPGPGGVAITTTTSGAVNPTATAAATQVLGAAGTALSEAVAQQTGTPVTVTTRIVHPTATPTAAVLPLAATSLLWLAALAANAVLLVSAHRAGRGYPVAAGLAGAGAIAVFAPAVVFGFAELWGLGIDWTWGAIGFMALVGAAFALLQGGLLRWLGVPGIGVLALLYLTAPAVAGQPPELLAPAYRVLLWSWTPIRFATDALRSLFFSGGVAPAVVTALWVFAGLAVAGLVALLWPRRRADGPAEPASDARPTDGRRLEGDAATRPPQPAGR